MNTKASHAQKPLVLRILSDHKTAMASIFIGLLIGTYLKPWVDYMTPFGDSYVGLLAMCIFPITVASIILGLTATLRNKTTRKKLLSLAVAFIGTLFLTFCISVIAGALTGRHLITQKQTQNMSTQIKAVENYTQKKADVDDKSELAKPHKTQSKLAFFLHQVTPRNIFAALDEGMTLKVILITLLIGVALGSSKSREVENLLNFIESANKAFKHIFHWILYLLPFGLMCIFAHNASLFNPADFESLIKMTLVICAAGFIIVAIYTFIICYSLKISLKKAVKELRKPILLSFTTMSSTVAIPSSIEALKNLKVDSNMVDLITPLGISINRQGNVMMMVLIAVVTASFYHTPLTLGMLIILFLGGGFMGAAAFGGGIILIPTYILICKLIGIPATAGIALLTITDLFVFWISLLVTLQANYALAAIAGKPNGSTKAIKSK